MKVAKKAENQATQGIESIVKIREFPQGAQGMVFCFGFETDGEGKATGKFDMATNLDFSKVDFDKLRESVKQLFQNYGVAAQKHISKIETEHYFNAK